MMSCSLSCYMQHFNSAIKKIKFLREDVQTLEQVACVVYIIVEVQNTLV